jgi:AcrR family transcriptional regulator
LTDPANASGPARKPRGRPSEISREVVVAAARRLLADGGRPDELSLRRLAAELRVTAMALYRYVDDKDELLELVADGLIAEMGLPDVEPSDWVEWMRQLALMLHDLITHHPVVAHVFSTRPVVTPASLRRMEAALRVLRTAGFRNVEAVEIYSHLHTYTLGFACLAASRSHHADREPPSKSGRRPARREAAIWRSFFRSLPPDSYPVLVELAPDIAEFTAPAQFERGIARILHAVVANDDRPVASTPPNERRGRPSKSPTGPAPAAGNRVTSIPPDRPVRRSTRNKR